MHSRLIYTIIIVEGNDLCFTLSHAPAVPRDTAGVCAMCLLTMDVVIIFPRQTRVYMFLREGLLF